MIAKRPSIFIYTNKPDAVVLKQLCAGIEENGVFYEVFERDSSNLDALAHGAANDSMMGAGLGVKGTSAALQMKGLPFGRNVETCLEPDADACRRLGANSARAIKKMSLL